MIVYWNYLLVVLINSMRLFTKSPSFSTQSAGNIDLGRLISKSGLPLIF